MSSTLGMRCAGLEAAFERLRELEGHGFEQAGAVADAGTKPTSAVALENGLARNKTTGVVDPGLCVEAVGRASVGRKPGASAKNRAERRWWLELPSLRELLSVNMLPPSHALESLRPLGGVSVPLGSSGGLVAIPVPSDATEGAFTSTSLRRQAGDSGTDFRRGPAAALPFRPGGVPFAGPLTSSPPSSSSSSSSSSSLSSSLPSISNAPASAASALAVTSDVAAAAEK